MVALIAGALGTGACPSAPKARVSALVRVTGEGETAWRNARGAARAVTLRGARP